LKITIEVREYATMPITGVNGPLCILDKQTKELDRYLNFNGRKGQPGILHELPIENGFANGFISFAFDPDYAHNGKFYTIHLERLRLSRQGHPHAARRAA
jgi:hypothetical protein